MIYKPIHKCYPTICYRFSNFKLLFHCEKKLYRYKLKLILKIKL